MPRRGPGYIEESVTEEPTETGNEAPQNQYASEAGGDESVEGTAGITGGVLSDTGGFPVAALGEAALLLAGAALVRRLLR